MASPTAAKTLRIPADWLRQINHPYMKLISKLILTFIQIVGLTGL